MMLIVGCDYPAVEPKHSTSISGHLSRPPAFNNPNSNFRTLYMEKSHLVGGY